MPIHRTLRRPRPEPEDVAYWRKWHEANPGAARGVAGASFGGPAAPGPGGAPPTAGANVVLLPPTVIRPPSSGAFSALGRNVAGVPFTLANTPAIIPGSQFQVPAENSGVIQSVVFQVAGLLATSDITFDVLFNDQPVQGWSSYAVWPVAAPVFITGWGPDETQIPVPDNTQISVRITVLDGGNYSAGSELRGWFYNKGMDDAFEQAWFLGAM